MKSAKRIIEWVLAAVGASICAGAALVVWQSQPYDVWPFPALYLIEIIALGTVGFVGLITRVEGIVGLDSVPWGVAGALLAFVILGAWTIGPLLLPAMLAFLIAATVANTGPNPRWIRHLGIFMIAGVSQASLMFVVIVLRSRL
jgi:hypothetical protein